MKALGSFFAPLEPRSWRERVVFISSAALALIVLLLDQGTKLWVEHAFKQTGDSSALIDGFLSFTYARNDGAAWSMLSGKVWLLLVIAFLAFGAILYFFHALTERFPERYFAVFLVLSGILGNSIDRLWREAVVDFIHVHYRDVWHYPIFNVADISICVGVGIFVLSSFIRPEKKSDCAGKSKWFGWFRSYKKSSVPEKDEDR